MRSVWWIFCIIVLSGTACSSAGNTQMQEKTLSADSLLMLKAEQVMETLHDKNYERFAAYIHSQKGIRFSPYGRIDTTSDLHFSRDTFLEALEDNTARTWGAYDGSGEPVSLTVSQYMIRFVYNRQYLYAPQHSCNKTLKTGNSGNNIGSVYPQNPYTEFHFPGTEKYSGMDWESLRLVFEKEGDELFLVGVVHDQWTI